MRGEVIPCGPFANASEERAVEVLKSGFGNLPGEDEWALLTNLPFSSGDERQFDEIDIVAIGPPGVRVIEVKHWSVAWMKRHPDQVCQAANLVTAKARRMAGTLKRRVAQVGFIEGAILTTQTPAKTQGLDGAKHNGVACHPLKSWENALGVHGSPRLSPAEVSTLAKALAPTAATAMEGSLRGRRLAGHVDLVLQTPQDERFHRIYKGVHSRRRHPVRLHLYDLSASTASDPELLAEREWRALQRLQTHPWAPSIEDSFQDVPGYPGEMRFFSESDSDAPSLAERKEDAGWPVPERIAFSAAAVRAVMELHATEVGGEPMLHRNLSPNTILVKHDNTPLLTGLHYARVPSDATVAGAGEATSHDAAAAPEVQKHGLGVADIRSDVHSLCMSLRTIFEGRAGSLSRGAHSVLDAGIAASASQRSGLKRIHAGLAQLAERPTATPSAPSVRFWAEGQIVRFRDRDYRIVSHLASGGVGRAFKVVEKDSRDGDLDACVAKAGHDADKGKLIIHAYRRAKPLAALSPALASVRATADEWLDNSFSALTDWTEGSPLSDFKELLPILAEDLEEASADSLALRWLQSVCEGLRILHDSGLVHGDISPGNLIVAGRDIVLTDYDCLAEAGVPVTELGTPEYCPLDPPNALKAAPSNDIFSLAASFFHVLFDRRPLWRNGAFVRDRGLPWAEGERDGMRPELADFLDRATHPDPHRRFESAREALALLSPVPVAEAPAAPAPPPGRNEVKWIESVLQSYPGSLQGNSETRGLDTEFAANTYVETALEEAILEDVQSGRARLVILCGNAGDGKTALLQHLAQRLGLPAQQSSRRIMEGGGGNGLRVRMNLDGSASWQGRSSDEMLDDLLHPFLDGAPDGGGASFLAINDGRLLEWIDRTERERGEGTPLTLGLAAFLDGDAQAQPPHIRFVNLNHRSLVGGISEDGRGIDAPFLHKLTDRLYGGEDAAAIWRPCGTCAAAPRCETRRAARLFAPEGVPGEDVAHRLLARGRLFDALQAVHLRGETHITVRELRATLAYVLFGTHLCSDHHAESERDAPPDPYWDRAFSPASESRQGEVLRELVRLDPALESRPKADRLLLSLNGYAPATLPSRRRRAYFEMEEPKIGLARGRHLQEFRDLPLGGSNAQAVCESLCRGISKLEVLPPQALDRPGAVPLRITPRTPTETAFWVEKRLEDFSLRAAAPPGSEATGWLHRQAILTYSANGRKETLPLGAELFHVLRELADGYQIGDSSSEDTFSQLAIFVQRLVREDDRRLMAWTPVDDEALYEVSAQDAPDVEAGEVQQIQLRRLERPHGE